ncbi:MAG: protein translocase subunit SecD, partial [Bacteroidota bacterium]
PLEGDHVVEASAQPDPNTGQMQVSLNMDQTGAKIWAKMTKEAFDGGGREIAIVLDDEVVSAPGVRNGAITGGRSSISGQFSTQEANDLANILEVGKLPARPEIVQSTFVGPSLGAENIRRSIISLVVGFALVLIFMMLYYGGGGIVSIVALFMNLFFIFGALASIGTVLTLPGIAGIILTIGMAVDANVIIYERIREELREGKNLKLAVNDGFQNSYSAIIDANVTTILTAIILAYFGLGPIKGFAVILIIGVLSSIFTAVLVGRLIVEWWLAKDKGLNFSTGMSEGAFANLNINWLGKRKMAYGISGTIIILGIISMFARGFDLGVDFKGGYSYNIEFAENANIDTDKLRSALTTSFGSAPTVKAVDVANTFNVITDYLVDDNAKDAEEKVVAKLHEGVNAAVGGGVDAAAFAATDGTGTHITSSSKVGPIIADDIRNSAFYASIFALLAIFLYLFIRFTKPAYSVGAVAALSHDVLVVLAIFSLGHGFLPFSLEVDQAFIAAVLTVIGYSINDTVVVFDRIREFMNTYTNRTKEEVINMAVNSTVSRTIITSLTTFLVVLILF